MKRDQPQPSSDPEMQLFKKAMEGVVPIKQKQSLLPPILQPKVTIEAQEPTGSLYQIDNSGEFFEGAQTNTDARLRSSLRRGDYAIQSRLDLHGKTVRQSQQAFENFILIHAQKGARCVLVVHGRGLHSPGSKPLIKEALIEWLQHGRAARHILAFSSARPQDGGTGAVYILLKTR